MTYNEIKKHKWKRSDIDSTPMDDYEFMDAVGEFLVVGVFSSRSF